MKTFRDALLLLLTCQRLVYASTITRVPMTGGTNITVNLDTIIPAGGTTSASCIINPPAGGTTHILNATATKFPGKIISSATHSVIVCHGVPAVVAPGPGVLVVSFAPSSGGGPTQTVMENVTYFPPVEWAISKRPYISETSGDILLRLDPEYFSSSEHFKISAELPAAGVNAQWTWDTAADATLLSTFPNIVLPLTFEHLPPNHAPIHNDMRVSVTRVLDGSTFVQSRRFHRVPPPSANSTVVPVQVDHTTRGLLVDGKSFIGNGFYMQQTTDWPSLAEHVRDVLVPMGVNVGMTYGLSSASKAEQITFLDACFAAGFKVMYPLGTGDVHINHGGPFNRPSMLKELIANVTFIQNHPALLGWYICDDCCSNTPNISLQSQVYQLIKDLDPYHVTIGAVNCGNSWMFTDQTPSWLTPETNVLSMRNIPEATQPNLQLSLDVIMQENYATTLQQHSGDGTWDGTGVGSDGFYRHGVTFEPLTNCPGTFTGTRYADPNFLLSAQWLGLVTAGMHDGLTFILQDVTEWDYEIQIGLFSTRVNVLRHALLAPFGTVSHPKVIAREGKENVRARGWSVPLSERDVGAREKRENSSVVVSSTCAGYVVVVNVNETEAVKFELDIVETGSSSSSLLPCNATRMFDEKGTVVVGDDGTLVDEVQPGLTIVYCLVKV